MSHMTYMGPYTRVQRLEDNEDCGWVSITFKHSDLTRVQKKATLTSYEQGYRTCRVPGKHPWVLKHNSWFQLAWVLTRDINCIYLYGSCYSAPLKFGTWVLTREWALCPGHYGSTILRGLTELCLTDQRWQTGLKLMLSGEASVTQFCQCLSRDFR